VPEPRVILEAVVETADAAAAAEEAGAARLELCVNVREGGITPPPRVIDAVVSRVSIPIIVMIRPRAGDFLHTADEVSMALRQIDDVRDRGVAGLVLGVLRRDHSVDVEVTRRLVGQGRGLPVTFHRAFDAAPDLLVALDALIAAGVTRVLTSGGAPSAGEGIAALAKLVTRAGDRLTVMPGGGVRAHNVAEIVAGTGAREVHARFETRDQMRAIADRLRDGNL